MYFFFFNDTATTEIYTLSLHDALPISGRWPLLGLGALAHRGDLVQVHLSDVTGQVGDRPPRAGRHRGLEGRSEEHTSELQSRQYLVCRLLLEKKKNTYGLILRHRICT